MNLGDVVAHFVLLLALRNNVARLEVAHTSDFTTFETVGGERRKGQAVQKQLASVHHPLSLDLP